jgi:hypothetical protein
MLVVCFSETVEINRDRVAELARGLQRPKYAVCFDASHLSHTPRFVTSQDNCANVRCSQEISFNHLIDWCGTHFNIRVKS